MRKVPRAKGHGRLRSLERPGSRLFFRVPRRNAALPTPEPARPFSDSTFTTVI